MNSRRRSLRVLRRPLRQWLPLLLRLRRPSLRWWRQRLRLSKPSATTTLSSACSPFVTTLRAAVRRSGGCRWFVASAPASTRSPRPLETAIRRRRLIDRSSMLCLCLPSIKSDSLGHTTPASILAGGSRRSADCAFLPLTADQLGCLSCRRRIAKLLIRFRASFLVQRIPALRWVG